MLKWSTTTFTSSDNDTATATAAATCCNNNNNEPESEFRRKKLNFGITASHCPSLHSVMIYIDYFYNLQRFNSLTYCFKPSTSRLRASIFKWLQTHLLFGSKLKHPGQPHSVSKNLSNKEERRDVWNPKMAIARQREGKLKTFKYTCFQVRKFNTQMEVSRA